MLPVVGSLKNNGTDCAVASWRVGPKTSTANWAAAASCAWGLRRFKDQQSMYIGTWELGRW